MENQRGLDMESAHGAEMLKMFMSIIDAESATKICMTAAARMNPIEIGLICIKNRVKTRRDC